MKKRLLILALALVMVCSFGFMSVACGDSDPVDPAKADGETFNTAKLFSTVGLKMNDHVKELKNANGGVLVKTEYDISDSAKMELTAVFKNDKFDDVTVEITGTDKDKYLAALIVDVLADEEAGAAAWTKSNDPAKVKTHEIRLPRSGQASNSAVAGTGSNNPVFNFDTEGDTDHNKVGTAAYECLRYAVAAYRFLAASKNVFGSYANYLEADTKAVDTSWTFSGSLVAEGFGSNNPPSPTVKIDKVLEFPKSYIVFATSTGAHSQQITTMVRIDKKTHKVLKADYAFFHVSEYRAAASAEIYRSSLTAAAAYIVGHDVTQKVYAGKAASTAEDPVFDLNGVSGATLTNSVIVNAFNATYAYYNAKLKA